MIPVLITDHHDIIACEFAHFHYWPLGSQITSTNIMLVYSYSTLYTIPGDHGKIESRNASIKD